MRSTLLIICGLGLVSFGVLLGIDYGTSPQSMRASVIGGVLTAFGVLERIMKRRRMDVLGVMLLGGCLGIALGVLARIGHWLLTR
jgi:hypothetical protein